MIWLISLPLPGLAEAQYFLDRYAMLDSGAHVYRDFSFDYGPLMFYPAVWLSQLLHLSLTSSHYIAWTVQWGIGVWLLGWTVSVAAAGTRRGRTIFLMLWAFFLTALIDSGPNYTPLRFAGTLAIATAVYRLHQQRRTPWVAYAVAVCGASALLLYSPEQGIALIVATLFFFTACKRPTAATDWLAVGCFAATMAAVFSLALHLGFLENVRTVGTGTLNLPLLVSFQVIVVLALIVVAACGFVSGFRQHRSDSVLLYLTVLSGACLPAALSRADLGHLVINTLGALITAFVVLSDKPQLWRMARNAFALTLLFWILGRYLLYADWMREQIRIAAYGPQIHSELLQDVYNRYAHFLYSGDALHTRMEALYAYRSKGVDPNAERLPTGTRFFAPMGAQRWLRPYADGDIVLTGRYPEFPLVAPPMLVNQKIAELKTHAGWPLVLPNYVQCELSAPQARAVMKAINFLSFVPATRNRITTLDPFCSYVLANYQRTEYFSPVPGTAVWIRRATPDPVPRLQP